jgi:hypothetical protein
MNNLKKKDYMPEEKKVVSIPDINHNFPYSTL